MTKNVKEIVKELLGKSLNSFHRKTGLTQVEKNNEMQDGILNGILSQVDDAYIEKTEQSNVIHLDGSGDGVVVLDSIEGNTIVNLVKLPEVNERTRNTSSAIICLQIGNSPNSINLKTNATYTCFVSYDIKNISSNCQTYMEGQIKNSDDSLTWFNTSDRPNSVGSYRIVKKVDTSNISKTLNNFYVAIRSTDGQDANATIKLNNIMMLEGDWTDKELPPYFEGLQSSFEEHKTDEGQYEIEILMKNKNLIPIEYKRYESYIYHSTYKAIKLDKLKPNEAYKLSVKTKNGNLKNGEYICISPTVNPNHSTPLIHYMIVRAGKPQNPVTFTVENNGEYYLSFWHEGGITETTFNNMMNEIECIQLEKVTSNNKLEQPKQNKIKLLINEPLRAIDDIKDRLCIKDGRLVIKRKCGSTVINILNKVGSSSNYVNLDYYYIPKPTDFIGYKNNDWKEHIVKSDAPFYSSSSVTTWDSINNINRICSSAAHNDWWIGASKDDTLENMRNKYLGKTIIYQLKESVYEEVLNEYGEPILLEGYENGTLYIDSAIIPTTSIRYTPKMESIRILKEVESNNNLLTDDINDNIIPYMMDVDLMIMEKEMALMSQKNIRKIGVEDMTSMQKRTGEMLERLIKGKTLNEQECKTRVTVYLNADKITDEQAKELNFLIDEIYA